MSKRTHRYTTIVKCDIVKVTETETDIIHSDHCEEKFITSSIPAMALAAMPPGLWRAMR